MNMIRSCLTSALVCGCIDLAAVGCGGAAGQEEQAGVSEALIRLTDVQIGADGKPTVTTTFITRQQMEVLKQHREESQRLRRLGAELPTVLSREPGVEESCAHGGTDLWAYGETYQGIRDVDMCCIRGEGGAYFGWPQGGEIGLYCPFSAAKSLWGGEFPGYVGNISSDCTQTFAANEILATLSCNSSNGGDPDYVEIN
jgi:hypothetical protein